MVEGYRIPVPDELIKAAEKEAKKEINTKGIVRDEVIDPTRIQIEEPKKDPQELKDSFWAKEANKWGLGVEEYKKLSREAEEKGINLNTHLREYVSKDKQAA